MHNNAQCHKTSHISEVLEELQIPVMKWPAQSPDLNPIENLWRDLKARFHLRFRASFNSPSTSSAAFDKYSLMIEECWQEQGQDLVDQLIESMLRHCQAVIAAKGGHTKY